MKVKAAELFVLPDGVYPDVSSSKFEDHADYSLHFFNGGGRIHWKKSGEVVVNKLTWVTPQMVIDRIQWSNNHYTNSKIEFPNL